MIKPRIRFLCKFFRGAIGKDSVVKHYGKKVVVTKFPDMTKIVASLNEKDELYLKKLSRTRRR